MKPFRLTDASIQKLKPGTDRREIADLGQPGLYLVMQQSGRLSWAYRYRSPVDGKGRKMTLGSYPALTLADARAGTRDAIGKLAKGIDPASQAKAEAEAVTDATKTTVDAFLDDFLSRHADKKLKASTAKEMRRVADKEIRPAWGSRQAAEITKRDVVRLLDGIEKRGKLIYANRVLAMVRKFFNWLVEKAELDQSPAAGVAAPSQEVSRDTVLTDDEIRWLWKATDKRDTYSKIVRLLLLTGQRRGEVAGMTYAEIDSAKGEWNLAEERTKNGRPQWVPFSPSAKAIMASAIKIKGCPFVFSTDGESQLSGWSKYKARLDRDMLKIARQEAAERGVDVEAVTLRDWRLHDLRRTCASGMASLNIPLHVVERLLNHVSGTFAGVAGVYNRHQYTEERRRALEAWDKHLMALLEGVPDNVIKLGAVR